MVGHPEPQAPYGGLRHGGRRYYPQHPMRLAVASAKPLVDEVLNSYDDLLQDIVKSQQYTN